MHIQPPIFIFTAFRSHFHILGCQRVNSTFCTCSIISIQLHAWMCTQDFIIISHHHVSSLSFSYLTLRMRDLLSRRRKVKKTSPWMKEEMNIQPRASVENGFW